MTVLVIVLLALALVASRWVSDHLDRSETREAIDNVDRLVRASALYISTPKVDTNGSPLPCQFPDTVPVTPSLTCCSDDGPLCAASAAPWSHSSWRELDFSQTEPHRYVYAYKADGTREKARFAAQAFGDLDCDGQRSTFERSGRGVVLAGDRCTLQLSPSLTIHQRMQ